MVTRINPKAVRIVALLAMANMLIVTTIFFTGNILYYVRMGQQSWQLLLHLHWARTRARTRAHTHTHTHTHTHIPFPNALMQGICIHNFIFLVSMMC